jgi:hypothetical protein
MYDSESIRHQIAEAWAGHIVSQLASRQERANAYKVKKIMLQAHAAQSYFHIEFEPHLLALSHEISKISEERLLEQILLNPVMIGILGGQAEILGLVSAPSEDEEIKEELMDEDMFFTQHFTSSLSEALGSIQSSKNRMDFNR